ncbi:nuclease-related domain-containing protein [Carnobacterium pleistocenium]|uniref:nuclease-related domain-containing protein n=1 Tax=Carnobacterium pleistocenium TaxID=181073 RepID=UPI0005583C8C|nr:nuclease-related domain-containing protein [Carnobacterium pleistocenium]
MIVVKKRNKSNYLRTLEAINRRMILSDEEKLHLLNMQKGFEGELFFDSLVEEFLDLDALVLNDLLFTEKGNTFQVDTLILTGDKILLFEVKNYAGNFEFNSHHLLTFPGKEIVNPLNKLDETSIKRRQLLSKLNSNLKLDPVLIFVNSAFTLYNAPIDRPVIFPTQIREHFSKINKSVLPLSKKQHYLADKILKEHHDESAFQHKFPNYTYHFLKKGLWCTECSSPTLTITQRTCSCKTCGYRTSVEETILRQIEDFKLLFPDLKVTTSVIYNWIDSMIPMTRIQKILLKHYTIRGATHGSYYE